MNIHFTRPKLLYKNKIWYLCFFLSSIFSGCSRYLSIFVKHQFSVHFSSNFPPSTGRKKWRNLIDLLTLTSHNMRIVSSVGCRRRSSFLRERERKWKLSLTVILPLLLVFFLSYLDVVSGMDTHRNEKQSMELKNHLFFTLINATATAIAAITLLLSGWEICLNTHSLKHTRRTESSFIVYRAAIIYRLYVTV